MQVNRRKSIRTMERLSTASRNDYYVSNRAPLQPLQFIKLPAEVSSLKAGYVGKSNYRRTDFAVDLGED